mmetsp:Transcript_20410/g.56790  ORF Transcript_20410/g.56790 Transcript_20410/m.56790 type:complete len:227 (+) Transcript_20410:979-1659(+)
MYAAGSMIGRSIAHMLPSTQADYVMQLLCSMKYLDEAQFTAPHSQATDQTCSTLNLISHLWHHIKQIRLQSVVRNLEDRSIRIRVDRHDRFGILHAGQVLDGTGDTAGDVQIRRHHLARLPHLPIVGAESGIDRGARGADGSPQLVGQLFENGKVLVALDAAPTADDDGGAAQVGAVGLAHGFSHPFGFVEWRDRVHGLNVGCVDQLRLLEARRAHRKDFHGGDVL